MAYDFVRASSQRLTTATTPVTAMPLTLSVLGYLTDAPTDQYRTFMAVQNDSGNASYDRWLINQALDKYSAYTSNSNFADGSSSSGANTAEAAVWKHVSGVFASATSRTLYLSGAAQTPGTTNAVPSNINAIAIGAIWNGSGGWSSLLNGKVAEVAVWNVALTADEISSLAKGFKPTRVRPQSLVFYAPLIRNLQDAKGGRAITNTNAATASNHPRVY